MLTREQYSQIQDLAAGALADAGIVLTPEEEKSIEIADFGLDRFKGEGLALHVHVNTERYCAKELVLFPNQTCPEHRHPPVGDDPGKMETLRCRSGKVMVYLAADGEPADGATGPGIAGQRIEADVPEASKEYYTVFEEHVLEPGEQVTIPSNTLHWFQAGSGGAVISEFSSRSRDEYDEFTDPRVQRETEIVEE